MRVVSQTTGFCSFHGHCVSTVFPSLVYVLMDILDFANITVVIRALRVSLQHTDLCVEDSKGCCAGHVPKHYRGSPAFDILRKFHTFWGAWVAILMYILIRNVVLPYSRFLLTLAICCLFW